MSRSHRRHIFNCNERDRTHHYCWRRHLWTLNSKVYGEAFFRQYLIYIYCKCAERTLIILHTQIKYMFWLYYYTLNCIINIISAYIGSYADNFMRITFTWTLIIAQVFMVFIDNFETSKDRILSIQYILYYIDCRYIDTVLEISGSI